MAEYIGKSKGFGDFANSIPFNTYVPELEDNANIQDAFELFYFGNSDNGETLGDVSLYSNIVDFDTRITTSNNLIAGHAVTGLNVHGIGEGNSVVGTGTSQTLANKTLTSPTLNSPTLNSPLFVGTSSIQEMKEFVTVAAIATSGSINYNVLTNHSILFHTVNAAGNFSINFRGDASTSLNDILSVGQSLTIAFLVTNGASAFYQTGLLIDGVSVTPKWQNGSAPTIGSINSIDIYSYTIIKTASNTYTVLESQTKFA